MKSSRPSEMSILRWSIIILAIIIAPAWAQNKKESAPKAAPQHNAPAAKPAPAARPAPARPAPQAQRPAAGGGGARPAAGGGSTGGKPAAAPQKSAGDTYKPAPGYGNAGGAKPAAGGQKPAVGGGTKPAPAVGGNRPGAAPAGGAKPAPAVGGNRPGAAPAGGTKPAPSVGGNRPGAAPATKPGGAAARPAVTKFNPPAGSKVTPNPRGGSTITAKNGTQFNTGRAGNLTSMKTKSGATARFGANGKVAQIRTSNMTINRGPGGGRVAVANLRGGGRVVSYGGRRGFVEHPFYRGGRPYMNRTYFYGGRPYAAVYRGYFWGGRPYFGYMPGFYFGAGFYGWAYNPWASPIGWGWGWGGSPWFGFYGGYFAPYPVYAAPAFWLTDYVISQNLQAAYEAQQAAQANAAAAAAAPPPAADSNAVILTPEVKQAIADEVRAQIQAEQAAAASPQATAPVPAASANAAPAAATPENTQLPDALNPKNRTFIVSSTLSETTADGTACSLSPGDVLTRIGDTPDANQNVNVMITSGQSADCPTGTQVAVAVSDLQDMHNDFRQKMDTGLQSLADNQGKKGMPASPAPDRKASPAGTAQPDADAATELATTDQDAEKAEADVQAAQDNGNGDD
jgi:hypothetical protein